MLSQHGTASLPASPLADYGHPPAIQAGELPADSRQPCVDARQLAGPALIAALRDSRARTWALVSDLTPAQWRPPVQEGVNPIAWELAHLAWFAEFWILRGPHNCTDDGLTQATQPPRIAGPDAVLDSARLLHLARWTTPLPQGNRLTAMLADQLEACVDAVPSVTDDAALYAHRLSLFHEDMHGEALCWLRAALGYPAPRGLAVPQVPQTLDSRPIAVRGGQIQIGVAARASGFAFDNERPGRVVDLPDFEIDSAPVTAIAFARFVDAGGYDQPRYWPGEAGAWRAQSGCKHPQQWRRNPEPGAGSKADGNVGSKGSLAGRWQTRWQWRWFDQWLPLETGMPAMHLNAFEAEAFCLWAGRHLPTAAQWECAAQQNSALNQPFDQPFNQAFNPTFHWGHSVWEWTADVFMPYPGFAPGPYREYSAPWFGDHRELRGGAFATHARLHEVRYRNFFLPHRTDVFTGFRTVAPC